MKKGKKENKNKKKPKKIKKNKQSYEDIIIYTKEEEQTNIDNEEINNEEIYSIMRQFEDINLNQSLESKYIRMSVHKMNKQKLSSVMFP